MWTNKKKTILYITKVCMKILPMFFARTPSRRWQRQSGLLKRKHSSERNFDSQALNDDVTVFQLSLDHQIEYLARCLDRKVDSEVLNDKITLGMLADKCRFMRSKESTELLRHILTKNRCVMLKQHFQKVEDYNLMLKARVEEQKQELKKAEEDKLNLQREAQKYFDELKDLNDHNRDLWRELIKMEKSESYSRGRVEAYGETLVLKELPDGRLEGIGMMIGVAMERWKREHVNREVDKKMSANPHFLCPITQDILGDPVVASDGHTYERHALGNWINLHGGKSPMTRQPISILRDDDALKHYIDSTRARLEKEISEKCELPKP